MHICADGTYKLIWQKHSLLVAGTTDEAKSFHPFGVMTNKRERTKDYTFFFESVKKAVFQCLNFEYRPHVLLADAAGSISKGFMKAFKYNSYDDFKRIVCYQHVKRAIKKHLNLVENIKDRDHIFEDIQDLQKCPSSEIFDSVKDLFILKWFKETVFLTYFR